MKCCQPSQVTSGYDKKLTFKKAIRSEDHIERRVKSVKEMAQVLSDDIRASTWIPKDQHDIYVRLTFLRYHS